MLRRVAKLEAASVENYEGEWRWIHETAEKMRKRCGLPSEPFYLPSERPPRTCSEWEAARLEAYEKLGIASTFIHSSVDAL